MCFVLNISRGCVSQVTSVLTYMSYIFNICVGKVEINIIFTAAKYEYDSHYACMDYHYGLITVAGLSVGEQLDLELQAKEGAGGLP